MPLKSTSVKEVDSQILGVLFSPLLADAPEDLETPTDILRLATESDLGSEFSKFFSLALLQALPIYLGLEEASMKLTLSSNRTLSTETESSLPPTQLPALSVSLVWKDQRQKVSKNLNYKMLKNTYVIAP